MEEVRVTRDKVKVLYIAGWGRSGSTLLDNLLGQVEGFFSAGELCYLWEHNLFEDGLCGCGSPLGDCEVWGRVVADLARIDAREMARLEEKGLRTRHLPLFLFPFAEKLLASRLEGYVKNLERLYATLARETGARVIVDSSKSPAYGRVLGMAPAVDLYVVHLVRDPRASAYSWLKKKRQPDRGELGLMDQHAPAKSSLMWDAWNGAAEAFWRRFPQRYVKLRYEDLVADPRAALTRVLGLVGEEDARLPFVRGREVELSVSHTMAGNPNRFEVGRVELRPDDEWKTGMRLRDRALVTALTFPGLIHHRYFPRRKP